jgi:predicted nucleic acid-binding protein
MTTALDSNILIDVLTGDARFLSSSKASLDQAAQVGALVISDPVYAEIAPQFETQEALELFLHQTAIELRPVVRTALAAGARAWTDYLRNREAALQCPSCGTRTRCPCSNCGRDLAFRQHILTDFLIGGHALANGARLLTRDTAYFRTYFPELELITPGSPPRAV